MSLMSVPDRRVLPPRRHTETKLITFNVPSAGQTRDYTISVGYFESEWPYQHPAEVFVSGTKAGSEVEAVARDAAVLLSIALQYGVPLSEIRHSITREQDGKPSSIMGAIVDHLAHIGDYDQIKQTPTRREQLALEVSRIVRSVLLEGR